MAGLIPASDPAVADPASASVSGSKQPGLRKIQVSSNKKPLYYFVSRAKHVLAEVGEVHLSALGQAISTMVTVVEILKKDGLAKEKSLSTSLEKMTDDGQERSSQKTKMEVVLVKTADFERLMEEQKDRPAEEGQEGAMEADD